MTLWLYMSLVGIPFFTAAHTLPVSPPWVMLNSNLTNGTRVCPGDVIVINCTTYDSLIQVWNVANGRVEVLAENHTQGTITNGHVKVLDITVINNVAQITSLLHIVASPSMSPNLSVSCSNLAQDVRDTISFDIVVPMVVEDVRALQYLNQSQDGTCILSISWRPLIQTSDIHYKLHVNSTVIDSLNTTLVAFGVLCGTHSIQVEAVNQCGDISPQTSTLVVDYISQMEDLFDKQINVTQYYAGSFILKFTPISVTLTMIIMIYNSYMTL